MISDSIRSLIQYLKVPTRRSAEEFDEGIEREIAFHVAERTDEYTSRGIPVEEARRLARKQFGDPSRIAMECRSETIGGLILWHRLHLCLTATLIVAIGATLIIARKWVNDTSRFAATLPPGIASMLDNDWTGNVTGRIVDEAGQPIVGAYALVVVKTWPDESYFQRAYSVKSDSNGRFAIRHVYPLNEKYQVQVAAVADNRELKSVYHSKSGGDLDWILIKLPRSIPFVLRVESERGDPLENVEALLHGRTDHQGNNHVVYFDSAQSLMKRTNADGKVELPFFQPEDDGVVMLKTPGDEWQTYEFHVPAEGNIATIRIPETSLALAKDSSQ